MEGTFDCFTTLLPQSIIEMFHKKSLRLRKYEERVETFARERRISVPRCENERGSPLAHNSVQAWNRKCVLSSGSTSLPTSSYAASLSANIESRTRPKNYILKQVFISRNSFILIIAIIFHSFLCGTLLFLNVS